MIGDGLYSVGSFTPGCKFTLVGGLFDGGGSTAVVAYSPSLDFSDSRNSMYLGAF